jgi:uncharacterized surface anchored protein
MKRITSLLLTAVIFMGLFASPIPASAAGADNYPLNSIVIKIEDIVTHRMLGGARFEIFFNNSAESGGYGTLVATVDSDSSGVIIISGLPSGYYIVRQTVPPNNYQLSINNVQHAHIKPDGTSIVELVFSNYRYGGLVVTLNDSDTGQPIAGARFQVTDTNGTTVGNAADGIYTTDTRGEFYLENLPAGDYRVTQLTAAQGYAMDANPNVRTVRLQHTSADQSMYIASFANSPLGSLLVRLRDSISKEPLSGAVFNVKLSGGADLGNFTTGANGSFMLPSIQRGTYIISQISAPSGYLLATETKTQYVNYVNTYAVDFENQSRSGLYIVKYDADTKAPLKDAKFNVYRDTTLLGTYTTNTDGVIHIPNLTPGWYTAVEIAAPSGYVMDDTPKSVQVVAETQHRLEFDNKRLASLQIIKTDEFNGEPLSGARFRVTTQSGAFVADITTDASGWASIPSIEPGWYVVSETRAPVGYVISEAARTVEVKATVPTVVTVTNRAENNLQIVKLDHFTRAPLAGAHFRVQHASGENVGTFITDSTGKILVGNLREGAYVISELKAPDGYQLDALPQTITVQGGKLHSIEFTNKPLSGIEIIKLDAITKAPLSGATFEVERANGEKIGTFKTDATGKVLVIGLTEGTYIVSETIAPEGYIRYEIPKTVVVVSGRLSVVEFDNKPLSGIQIIKMDANSKAPLSGAVFTVERPNGERIGKYTTNISGQILVTDLTEGIYIISETEAPAEYVLDALPQTVEVKSGRLTVAEFVNTPYPYLHIVKTDAATGALLAGAEITVTNSKGELIANVTSQASGAVSIKVAPGVYTVTETKAPAGYELNDPVQTVEVRANGSAVYYGTTITYPSNTAAFANKPLNAIEIIKLDSVTRNPLSGAVFSIDKLGGERIGSFVTDSAGIIFLSGLTEGSYIISETAAPTGYILSELPRTVNASGGKIIRETFLNKPLSGIQITKLDAVTQQPLAGASFSVTKANGEQIGTFRTGADGMVLISDLDEGVYVVSETAAPNGYQLDETPKNVTVISGRLATVEFFNKPLSGIQITKIDAVTKAPLAGASFEVTRSTGERIGIYKTDAAGQIIVSDLAAGVYIVSETAAPTGYILDAAPQNVTVTPGKLATVEFTNKPLSGIQIIKLDAANRAPLAGATFLVERDTGERIGTYRTDASGKAIVPGLPEGTYIVSEAQAPAGYILDTTPQTVIVKSGGNTEVEFVNKAMAGLQIIKLNSATRQPIEGAEFAVARMNGERVGTYKTNRQGIISITTLEPGWYTVSEIKAADGYHMDAAPQNVEIKWGATVTLEITNTPMSGLLIVKTDAATGKPLAGVVFEVKKPSGEQIGIFTTDISGQIRIPNLAAGKLIVTETQALSGYELDTAAREVTIFEGRQTTLQVTNKAKAGLRLVKIDSISKKPIYNVEFTVYDSNNKPVGVYYTDNNGVIDFSGVLSPGRYTIRETRAAPGYYRDDVPRTVEFVSGKITEVRWENTPQLAQIQILKKSGDDNEVNGLPAGTPLQGAIFEAYEYKSGNLVDRFVSGADGRAVSKPLPLGRYIIKEVQAPQWYKLSTQTLDIELEFATQIVKLEFLNYSANTGVTIRKTGPAECMPGDTIRYDIRTIQNNSTVPLTDFYWRDTLAVDAVRLEKIVTGTFNQSLRYKVMATTNKGETIVIADNLSSTVNNVIDCRGVALGLRNDEFITSVTFLFGTVKAGFCQVLQPQVFVKVLANLPNGYQFANKADVGGKYGREWVVGNSTAVTTIYAKPEKLPRTGY